MEGVCRRRILPRARDARKDHGRTMDKGRGKMPVILRRVREEKRAREGKARKTGWLDGLVRGREGEQVQGGQRAERR